MTGKTIRENSDIELIRDFRKGNQAAFDELVHRYQDQVYRVSMFHLRNPDLAREAAQEVFIRAWRKLGRWRIGTGKPFTWLYRTTFNVCRELRRKAGKESRLIPLDNYLDIPGRQTDGLLQKEEQDALREIVNRLPERQREIVLLHIYEDMTLGEVALALDIPSGTVRSNYHKALVRLRKEYPRMEGTEPAAGRGIKTEVIL